jgi:5'-nucleotidase
MTALHILITNDDGVDAPGLDALVRALAGLPAVDVTVIAPTTNQTGASGSITTTEFDVLPAETIGGHAATAVTGSPSDAVLFALQQHLAERPALVVAGVNEGPNLADFVTMSGTVAAALAAARLGVPALAVSAGLAPEVDYASPARFAASFVARFRDDVRLRTAMLSSGSRETAIVLNVNFPPMPPRGTRVVPLGRMADVTGYVRRAESGARVTWEPVIVAGDITRVHRESTLGTPATDLEAFNHGFVSITPLVPDLTLSEAVGRFAFLEELTP